MCGIAGVLSRKNTQPPEYDIIKNMLATLDHRGPDSAAVYLDNHIGLGHARNSIIDLSGGQQPLTNEDKSLWLICNGEIFNYVELRRELEVRGHRFRTGSDCETILHLYEERGADCVHALNGQFAFALWDSNRKQLILARDRFGICPLYYAEVSGALVFGSEIKSLLTHPNVPREIDPVALGEVFTTWAPIPPRTMFKRIHSVRAGDMLTADLRDSTVRKYWRPVFPDRDATPAVNSAQAAEHLADLLLDATRLRMRADVPVGAYVSGGLDSAAVAAMARRYCTGGLRTFSIAFAEDGYDESAYQEQVTRALGTEHRSTLCTAEDIGRALPEVVWHTEAPLLRTAAAPLYLLSKLVRAQGVKVVLTGEGSDEFLVGYDIFKEAKVRAFWASQPESKMRPLLLRRLYQHVPELATVPQSYLEAFFRSGIDRPDAPAFSHLPRWNDTRRIHRLLTPEMTLLMDEDIDVDLYGLQAGQDSRWDQVSRAQYYEIVTFLEPYLLSSQGDRVAMAHAVEPRFPFLDHRVVEFCNSLPSRMKMPGLNEKALLKRAMADLLPSDVLKRPKQPFRAPIRSALVGQDQPDCIREVLDPKTIARDGVFKPEAVRRLLSRARGHSRFSEVENMALVGIVSFGLFKKAFVDDLSIRVRSSYSDVTLVGDSRTAAVGDYSPGLAVVRGN